MVKKGLITCLVIAAVVAVVVIATKSAAAAGEFICPYGDGLVFTTLAALQQHVMDAHPGQRIPISIMWS
jgi:hypothetical protein